MFTEFTELIPGLPDDLALDCLTRLHYTAHWVGAGVCRRWRELFLGRHFYHHRKRSGFTGKAACLVQSLPARAEPDGQKPVKSPSYAISVFEPESGVWDRIDPIPKYPEGLPLFCQVLSSEGKLVVMGGWDPGSWNPVRDVFVYEFTTRRWTRRLEMPGTRSFFAAGAADGRVFVAGGHDENKNALSTAWVYDIRADVWAELDPMSEERDECEGVVIGSEFWVVSGYDTDTQGGFKRSAEVLDIRSGRWRRVEEAWRASQCPRSCVGIGGDGTLICWAESDPNVRVGVCGVDLGEWTVVMGSAYQMAQQGFFLVEKKGEGQNGKLVKVGVPDEFSGFVQSGCSIEI